MQPSQMISPLPKVAVCLAAFNGVLWLKQQLDSIIGQSGVAVTIFISVDASSDGTEEWVDAVAQSNNHIVILPHGRHFGGAAGNFFRILNEVDFSEFDYVSFADQDDIWLSNKLIRAHEVLLSTNADAYSSNVIAFWQSGRKVLIKKSQAQVRWDFLFEAAGPGCTYVLKKNLAQAIQDELAKQWIDVQEIKLHDWFAYAYARAHGYRWIIDEYAGLLYRQHNENQIGVNYGGYAFIHRVRIVLNGWGLTQAALIARILGLNSDPFISRWLSGGKIGLFWLALHACQCRRRARDKILFALSCIALCFGRRIR